MARAPITMAPGPRHPRRWNLPGWWGWCRRGRASGAATGGRRRQTGNEHRPSPLPAGADGSPRLGGRRGAGEATEVTGAGAGGPGLATGPTCSPTLLRGVWLQLEKSQGAAPWLAGARLALLSCWDGHPTGMGIPPVQASPRYQYPLGIGIPLGWASHQYRHPPGISIPLGWASHQGGHPLGLGIPLRWAPPLVQASSWNGFSFGMSIPRGWT